MAWKTFENGYPLYASELNNYLMKQSVVVFASAAERDSILTAPTEGQVVWLQDSNAFKIYNGTIWTDINDNTDAIQKSLLTTAGDTIYATGSATPARLALGTSGQVLTSNGSAPYWSTISAGGMTLISTTSLSGSASVGITIPQTYKDIRIIVEGATTGSAFYLYIFPNSTNQYSWVALRSVAGTVGTSHEAQFGSLSSAGQTQHGTQTGSVYMVHVYDYASTTSWKAVQENFSYKNGSGNDVLGAGGGSLRDDAALTAFTLQPSAGTFTGGTAYLYGVK